jgi:signal transduction histidine kinase
MTNDERATRILILMPVGRDGQATAEVLARANFLTFVCRSLREFICELELGAGAACLAEEALAEGGYDELKTWVKNQLAWSDLPFVVLSSRVEDPSTRRWRETLTVALQNVSLLERPVHGLTLISALKVALRSRMRQYEVREHIAAQQKVAHTLEVLVAERTRALENSNRVLMLQIAERQQLEDQLRQSQKMEAIGQLTGGLAHDFNNMLAIVVAALNLLSRRLQKDDPGLRKYIDAALDGAQRATQLTQRLLAFSRRQTLAPKAVNLDSLLLGMLELLRGTVGRAISVEVVPGNGAWSVLVDPVQLENAIINIALNARDAMPDGGKLTIETQDADLPVDDDNVTTQFVEIKITDTGVGIPHEAIGKVFEPFFTTKIVGKGTGLGLSQVYGFVKQSGGQIKLASAPNQGTTVIIHLPRHEKAEAEDPSSASPAVPGVFGKKELILVVDDEQAVRGLAADALEELGYRAMQAKDGLDALRLLDQHPEVVLLLTDIVMPDLNGRMLAERATQDRPDLRVLYMTGFANDALRPEGPSGAVQHIMGKPFTIEELADKIRLALQADPSRV